MPEHHQPKKETPSSGGKALLSGSTARTGGVHQSPPPKVSRSESKASIPNTERMVEARLLACLPPDSPRRKVTLPKIGGGK